MYRVVMVAVAVVFAVTACTDGDADSDAGSSEAVSAGAPSGAPVSVSDRVEEAVADFAAYADVDPGEVEVLVSEQVTWRDGSLGCPDPDTAYTEELVEGYRVVLRADSEEATYHGKAGLPPFYCVDPDPEGTVDDRSEESRTTDAPDAEESG